MPRPPMASAPSSAARYLPALLLGLCVIAAAGGLALAARLRAERPNPTVEIEGLQLRLERASWADRDPGFSWGAREGIDVGAPWLGPHASLQGMPAAAGRRLALTLLARNVTRADQRLAWGELVLRAEGMASGGAAPAGTGEPILTTPRSPGSGGAPVAPGAPIVGRLAGDAVTIPAGHAVVLDASFEVSAADEEFALWWERHTARARLLVTRSPRQRSDGPPPRWPLAVSELPAGRAEAGSRLFHGRLACASCHGDPAAPDARGAGPALGAIGRDAGLRQRDRSAAQYLYESLLDPFAFLSPACAGQPCASVQMPAYGEILSPQEAADLVAFLLAQRRAAIR